MSTVTIVYKANNFSNKQKFFCKMDIKGRLLLFLKKKGLSQGKFEKTAELSNGFVNNIGEGISTQSLIKILKVYPDLNATWLLTEKGGMLLDEKSGTFKMPDPSLLTQLNNEVNALQLSLRKLSESLPISEMLENQNQGGAYSDLEQDKSLKADKQ